MARLGFWTLLVVGSVAAVACESSDGGGGGGGAAAGAPDGEAGEPGNVGGTEGSGATGGTNNDPVAGESTGAAAGTPGSAEAGAGGMTSAAGGSPNGSGDALEGCMTPTPGIVDYCADEPKKNAIYCVAPSESPFADCSVAPDHPINFDGWCCETAACVRATSWDAICGVLAPGKTAGYTCHLDAEAPSADCMRTDDGACCPP